MLNRLNYISGLSHLRRVSTPIEKMGKLIAPRKLHNTQWGYICPCETPEGHSVGVVKNMSTVAIVSIFSNPRTVSEYIATMGGLLSLRDATIEQKHQGVRVFLNGAWIGVLTDDAERVVEGLRSAKRRCELHPQTGIIWKMTTNELWITTEAGRMLRPLFYAPALRECMAAGTLDVILSMKTWEELLLWKTPVGGHNLIEYIDPGETETLLFAMNAADVVKNTSITHAEIHPSCSLGSLGSNIPFPDHNQSPRNAYQCLAETELVLMSDGSRKAIRDIKVGDSVITFDPKSHMPEPSIVVNHYVRDTDKKIFTVKTTSGRSIVATQDHPFMTADGWKQVEEIGLTDLVGIQIHPDSVSSSCPLTVVLYLRIWHWNLCSNKRFNLQRSIWMILLRRDLSPWYQQIQSSLLLRELQVIL